MQSASMCRCGVDVHAHVIPHDFPAYLGSTAPSGWPSMAPAHACHRHVMIDGKNYRTVSEKCWSTSKRLADFDEMGLGLQAISPMPELLSYWLSPKDGAELVRYLNEQIALMVSESTGGLVGLGAVPLQDMDMACSSLGSNIASVPPPWLKAMRKAGWRTIKLLVSAEAAARPTSVG